MSDLPTYKCPECGGELDLFANGDNGPADDCWSCEECGVNYPHSQFPLPKGYVKRAIEAERERAKTVQGEIERASLLAWNRWARDER